MAGTDFSHLTNDELIKGIKALDLPDYIRSKAYGIDVRETLAQMTEMTIQLGVNMGLSPDEALKWARKLQESVSQSEFDSWVATLLDGGPSIFMNTLSELQSTYPNGAPGVALVRETDPSKIYVWNGTAWEDFGDYQGIEVKDGTITSSKLSEDAVTPRKTTFLELDTSINMFDGDYTTAYIGGSTSVGFTYMDGNGNVAVFEIQPNTPYSLVVEESDNKLLKVVTSTRPLAFDDTPDGAVAWSSETYTNYRFVSGANDRYLYINNGFRDTLPPYLKVVQSEELAVLEDTEYPFKLTGVSMYSKSEVDERLKQTEDRYFSLAVENLFNGVYVKDRYLAGGSGTMSLKYSEAYDMIVVDVKPNTTYTILKEETPKQGDYYYFKLATDSRKYEDIDYNTTLNGIHHSSTTFHTSKYTFTTTATDRTLLLNVAKDKLHPYVEILEGEHTRFQLNEYGRKLYQLNDNVKAQEVEETPNGLYVESDGSIVTVIPPSTSDNKIVYEFSQHVNSSINLDVWRLSNIYYYDKIKGKRYSITSGDNEGVLRIQGQGDYVGGIHGDEVMTDLHVFKNGVAVNLGDLNGYVDSIEFVTGTDVYNADSTVQAFRKERSVLIDSQGVHIRTEWRPLDTFTLGHTRATLLSIHKLTDTDNIKLIDTYRTTTNMLPLPVPAEGETVTMPNDESIDWISFNGGAVSAKIWNIDRGNSVNNKGTVTDFGYRLKAYIDGYISEVVTPDDIVVDEHSFIIRAR